MVSIFQSYGQKYSDTFLFYSGGLVFAPPFCKSDTCYALSFIVIFF